MQYNLIPDELKPLKQWGLFRKIWQPEKNKYTKIPHNAVDGGDGKSNDPTKWTDFKTALKALTTYQMDGLGFYFKAPYVGIDVDHIPNDIERWKQGDKEDNEVQEFMGLTSSYTETSLSGAGIHIIVKGEIPGDRRRKKNVEMYESGRFFAMTGNLLGNIRTINSPKESQLKFLYDKYLHSDNVVNLPNVNNQKGNNLNEDEIIQRAEESSSGKRFKLFMRGGWQEFYPSQSEADLAFANDLAFWTGRDFAKMDNVFRQSSLMRSKWDERRGKTTYGTSTLNKAINETNSIYQKREPLKKYIFNFDKQKSDKPKPARSWDDTGNADRMIDLFGSAIRYSYIDKAWYIYNGSFWEMDESGIINKYVDMMIDTLKNEKITIPDGMDEDKAKEAFKKFIKKTRSNRAKKSIIDELQHRVPVLHREFDKDKTLLNSENGYVDLTNGILHDHDIHKMFSKQTNVEFTDNVDAPEWNSFLKQIFNNDQDLIHYIQKAVGYSLTGSVKEQVMFFLYGNGRNGKSVFIDTIADLLGNYAKTMQAESIMIRQTGGTANSDIARLEGARLVISSEPNEGVRLDEGLVKQLTGGDKVTARFLYGKEFEFEPEFKIWLATNHKPIIRGTDDGIWRRLMLIPFDVQIPDSKVDKDLKYKLKREEVGILNWAVDGAVMWQREGLNPPQSVAKASQEYRSEMDVIDMFVSDNCEKYKDYEAPAGQLFKLYKQWAADNSEYSMSKQKFGSEMKAKYKYMKNRNGRYYSGIRIKQDSRLNFINN